MSSRLPLALLLAFLSLPLLRLSAAPAGPEIQTEPVIYKIGDATYEGCVSRPVKLVGKVPGVLVAHDWTGFGPFSRARAEQLARLGYVAFALDMYGQGVHAKNPDEAGKLSAPFYKDFSLFRTRAQAALAELLKQPGVDPERIGAIGFCFGGTTVLELARAGADVRAVVTFHGGLKTSQPAVAGAVKAKELLILHGANDPLVPPADVTAFKKEMDDAKVTYKFIAYPGAVHAFTNPEAGNDPSKPTAYNAQAAESAYGEMREFFGRLLVRGAAGGRE